MDRLASHWSRVELHGFPQLVQYEECEPWLHRRLSDLGLLKHIDDRLSAFLTRRTRQVTAHRIVVDLQRDALVEILDRNDIPYVLLKGAAYRLLRDRYPYLDARMTGDVDVLLPAEAAPHVWNQLRHEGFHAAMSSRDSYDDHHHLEPLAGERRVVVELHTSTAERLAPAEAWQRMRASSLELRRKREPGAGGAGGLTTRVPCATELFWHAVSHAHSTPLQAFRLRCLQDAATIWASGEEIDWVAVASRLDGDELPSALIARSWLQAAAWLAGQSTIDGRLAGRAPPFDLHRALRWRLVTLRRLRPARHTWVPNALAHHPASRARRFAIDVGTAADLGVSPTHRTLDRSRLGRIAMRIGGAVIRRWYWGWKVRMEKGQRGR